MWKYNHFAVAKWLTAGQGFQSLNDRQSNIFDKFGESKEPIQSKLSYGEVIPKSFIDLRSNAWFTLGSDNETMVCDT